MSDWHALQRKGNQLTMVFHFRVPDITNSAGMSVRSLLAADAKASIIPNISTQEANALSEGRLYEFVRNISVAGKERDADIQRTIERAYDNAKQHLIERLTKQYEWYGAEGDV